MIQILLVDDHHILRLGLKQALSELFPEVIFGEAASVAEARTLLAQQPWHLILLDINMPGGPSGLDLLAEVRKQEMEVAILVLSAYPEEEFAIRAFKAGADGYLTKASVTGELFAAVRKVMAGGKYVSALLAEKLARVISVPLLQLPHETLSARELDVLQGVARGKTIKVIAAELFLSEKTVATYRKRAADKLNISTNVELARYALQHGLVD
jgi:DNA-binding NarL/FixJ family response regulator